MNKFLYLPIKPFTVTQRFGEDTVCYRDTKQGRQYARKETKATCPVTYRSVYSQMKGHNGLDAHGWYWQPVYAAAAGKVVEVSTEEARGLGVGIVSSPEKRTYYKHRYWHFIGLHARLGQEVARGELIGWVGDTGYATGPHLHFELKKCDKNGNTLDHDNGYFGAIDPAPFMFDVFAGENAPHEPMSVSQRAEVIAKDLEAKGDKDAGVVRDLIKALKNIKVWK